MNAHFVTGVDYGTLSGRGIEVDHVTIYRWAQRFTPLSGTAGSPTNLRPSCRLMMSAVAAALRLGEGCLRRKTEIGLRQLADEGARG
jgi:hypothetical protein